jgi:hypothetical protein
MFIILDMKKNKIDHFSLKIIVLTGSVLTAQPWSQEMSNLYREPPINASYHVSVHLAKRFQRRFFLEIN